MKTKALDVLREMRADRDKELAAIQQMFRERDELLRALAPFAAAYSALPQSVAIETTKKIVDSQYGHVSTYLIDSTEVLVRVGERVLRVGDLAHAAVVHGKLNEKGGE